MKYYSQYLLGIIVLVFILQLVASGVTETFWLDPATVFQQPWTLVTSMFLHGGIAHLFFNGYALFLFGLILEREVGNKEYLKLYFLCGILAGLTYAGSVYLGAPSIPALGASGAIYGVLGAVAMLKPNMRIFFWFIPMKMRTAAIIWIVIEFLGTFNPASGVASAAHLGGLVVGLIYAWYLKRMLNPPYPSVYYQVDPYERDWA